MVELDVKNCDARLTMTGDYELLFTVDKSLKNKISAVLDMFIKNDKPKRLKVDTAKKKRSLDANGTLWLCLGKIADALGADKWDIYLKMLKRYGKYTYLIVKENAVESVKAQWRECEVVGEVEVNGNKGIQMLCYFGSSHYNSKEFSILLDGVISEMKEMGLDTPISKDLERVIEELERSEQCNKDG